MPGLPVGTVTFLFTNIEGSTPLWEKMPRAMQQSVALHHAILRQVIEAHDGQVFQIVGDAFQAAFTRPGAGLEAAIAVQRALDAAEWGETGALRVRMGLHTGPAEISPILGPGGVAEYAVAHTLNRAARVMSAGHGGQILLSQPVKDLVERDLPAGTSLRDLGEHHLKGMTIPEHLYQVEAPGLRAEFPPLPTAVHYPNNLPAALTSFIGREADIDLLKQRLGGGARLVTLTGTGGAGKTRLAIQVGRAALAGFPGGAWLVELAPISDPALVYPAIAGVLSVRETPGQPLPETLAEHLGPKRLLLILDNCEHLLEECARAAAFLTQRCPHLVILSTSREILNLAGETSYRVPSLSLPPEAPPVQTAQQSPWQIEAYEAVRLFVERARQSLPDFALDDSNALAVAAICRRLDGVPLAIELAAARMRVLSAEQIAGRLDNAFALLTGGSRGALPRQQTLRAAVDWSYTLLSPPEQVFFQRLALFAGGWSLEAAEAVCGGDGIEPYEVLDLLSALVDKSLVMRGEDGRYHLHEMLRQYAAEVSAGADKSAGAGKSAGAEKRARNPGLQNRYCAYYAKYLQERFTALVEQEDAEALAEAAVEMDNLRAAWRLAVEGGRIADLRCMAEPLASVHMSLSRLREGLSLFSSSARRLWTRMELYGLGEVSRQDFDLVYASLLFWYGEFSEQDGSSETAYHLYQESLKYFERLGARREKAMNLMCQAICMYHQTQGNAALLRESLEIFEEIHDQSWIATCLLGLGAFAARACQYQQARNYEERALAINAEIGNQRGRLVITNSLAYLEWILGNYPQSLRLYQENLDMARALGDNESVTHTLLALGRVHACLGRHAESRRLLLEGLSLAKQIGQAKDQVMIICELAELDLVEEDYPAALRQVEEVLAVARKMGFPLWENWCFRIRGHVACEQGDYPAARRDLLESLAKGMAEDLPAHVLLSLVSVGRLLAALGQPGLAGEALAYVIHHPVSWQWARDRAAAISTRLGLELPQPPDPGLPLEEMVEQVARAVGREAQGTG